MSINIKKRCLGQGFSLLEVLISLTILAVGLLGMAALQNEALKFNHAAFTDSQAQFLITDMVERIRANRGNNQYGMLFSETPSFNVDCAGSTCSSNQMAAWDKTKWRANVENTAYLPEGESEIVFDTVTRDVTVSIRYNWSQLGGIATDTRTVSVTTRIE